MLGTQHTSSYWLVNLKRADEDALKTKRRAAYFDAQLFLDERKEDRDEREELGI